MQATQSSWSSLKISYLRHRYLSMPSSSIVSANKKVQSVLESKDRTLSGRKGRYAKLSPELKAEISRRAAEHGVAATARLYARLLGDGCG